MRIRIAVLVLLMLALAGVGVWQWRHPSPAEVTVAPAVHALATHADTLFAWHDVHSFAEARAMLRDAYRLAPDRRFLVAVADVPLLAGGATGGPVAARWTGERWSVTCGADTVGFLPEFPAYADARTLLATWAARFARPGKAPMASAKAAVHDDPLTELQALDSLWLKGDRGPALQAAGAEQLGWLAFADAGDCTRQSDLLAGRALAALALANSGNVPATRTHVLLARIMGYENEAAALSGALDSNDPRRAWARRDTAALARLASGGGAGTEARLLRLHALAEDNRVDAWYDALAAYFPIPGPAERLGVATGLVLRTFESAEDVATWTAFGTTFELQRWTHTDTAAVARALTSADVPGAFERMLLSGGPPAGGPLLDAAIVNAHARAQLYTALSQFGLHQSSALFHEASSRSFAAQMGKPGPGPAGEFARWYNDLVNATWGKGEEATPLASDLTELGTLGAEQLEATYDAAAPQDHSAVPLLTRAMVRRMDSRPRDREWLAWTSIAEDLALEGRADLLAASAGAGGAGGGTAALWLAAMRGDDASLVRGMGSPAVPIMAKVRMLALLEGSGQPVARLQRCGAAAAAAHPGSDAIVLEWARGLEQHGDPEHARRVLESWLDRPGIETPSLGIGAVLARVARYYRLAGMPERAWTVLRYDSTGKFDVLAEQALALDALGRSDAALRLGQYAFTRYHGESSPSGLLAELHWAHGRDSLAAEALKQTLDENTWWRWTLGPDFVDRFRGRPQAAIAATQAMARVFGKRRGVLRMLGAAYADAGDPVTGFEIVRHSLGTGIGRAFELEEAYELAKRAGGRDAALAWLDSVPVPIADVRMVALETGAAYGHDELAWRDSLATGGQHRDWGLLVRAPAFAAASSDDPRREPMRAELHSREGTYYLALARYVAEGGDVEGVLRFADNSKHRAEVFFWIGRRAEFEGRQADAAACYQLCQETAATTQGEWLWSRQRLAPLLTPLKPLRETAAPARTRSRAT